MKKILISLLLILNFLQADFKIIENVKSYDNFNTITLKENSEYKVLHISFTNLDDQNVSANVLINKKMNVIFPIKNIPDINKNDKTVSKIRDLTTVEIDALRNDFKELKTTIILGAIDKGDFIQIKTYKEIDGIFVQEFFYVDGEMIFSTLGPAEYEDGTIIGFNKNKEIIEAGVAFETGKGLETLYEVSDPECPYCRQLEKTKDLNSYKIKRILFPLPFHKNAKSMLAYVFYGGTIFDQEKRLEEIMVRDSIKWLDFHPTKKQQEELDNYILRSSLAFGELGARGTPYLYDSDLRLVPIKELKNKQ
jgi:thiol:disulfide interchange protein DsbC